MNLRSRFLLPFFLFLFCFSLSLFSQAPQIDSVLTVLKTAKEDTSKVNSLNYLSESYWKKNLLDKAWTSAKEALSLSERLDFTGGQTDAHLACANVLGDQGETDKCVSEQLKALQLAYSVNDKYRITLCLNSLGSTWYNNSDYPKAMDFFIKALKVGKETGNKKMIARSAGYIGLCYNNQGNYPKALEYDLIALKNQEEIGSKKGMASALVNLGVVYDAQNNVEKAVENYNRALEIAREISYQRVINFCLINLGGVYQKHGDTKKALDFFSRALKEMEAAGDNSGIAATLNNIGALYEENMSPHPADKNDSITLKVLSYYQRALDIHRETSSQEGIAMVQTNIGNVLAKQGKYAEALACCFESLKIAKEVNSLNQVKETEKILAEIYRLKKDAPNELLHYKAFIAARDSLFNEENTANSVRAEMNFNFEKKEAAEKMEQEKKDLVAEENLKRQKQISYSVVAGLILLLIFSFLLFNRFRIIRKQKEIIEAQKAIVDEKNKEITDSIHYAKRIQTSLLPTEKYIERKLKDLNKKR